QLLEEGALAGNLHWRAAQHWLVQEETRLGFGNLMRAFRRALPADTQLQACVARSACRARELQLAVAGMPERQSQRHCRGPADLGHGQLHAAQPQALRADVRLAGRLVAASGSAVLGA